MPCGGTGEDGSALMFLTWEARYGWEHQYRPGYRAPLARESSSIRFVKTPALEYAVLEMEKYEKLRKENKK